ncbi:MAG: glyoxylate/hydroxypyruvate reductase A [Desulfobacterales bacterium]|nr:MAG: glyoxylate/hydroxypyruvate reductase A [Desulfobacterales bacterium]
MSFLIIAPGLKVDSWIKQLRALEPRLDLRVWPQVGDPDEIEFALTWNHPPGEFNQYKNLKCIASLGAGVDHILRDPALPASVPVTRVVEASMAQSMSEYILLSVLNYCRHLHAYHKDQSRRKWQPRVPLPAHKIRIGILGLGQLGADAARKLCHLGFQVGGWSRTSRKIPGVSTFAGNEALDNFLSQTNILICLLPLTPATEGILNLTTFAKLPAGAYVINAARGAHLVEKDLLKALETGQISGACLDVFQIEPLPEDHPFWDHPQIVVTPHISSLTYPKAVAPQIVDNYNRVKSGKAPMHVVDIERGY